MGLAGTYFTKSLNRSYFISKSWWITILLAALFSSHLMADKTKQALKAMESGDLIKSKEIILKSIEKDGMSAGLAYAYATLFSIDSFPEYNIDSAHFYIQLSSSLISKHDKKDLEQFEKVGVNVRVIKYRNQLIDSIAYDHALKVNTVDFFNKYLTDYDAVSYTHLTLPTKRIV